MSSANNLDSNGQGLEDRLDEAIVEYLEACEAGTLPDRVEFLAKHASVSDRLSEFLDNRQDLDRMIKPIRQFQELVQPAEHPKEFGDYTLIREIGRGGMGIIYEARKQNLQRHVALKMIAGHELRSENARRRFQLEAESASTLEHTNIVRIYDVGQFENVPFFTMKLVTGGSLKDALKDGPFEPMLAAEVASYIAKAVSYAHQRGILHRDLKPGNILMDVNVEDSGEENNTQRSTHVQEETLASDGRAATDSVTHLDREFTPMISDFGLAKRIDEQGGVTLTGAVLGTPSFMSPEQASGGKQLVTTATDTYSIGAILYNMLTGAPPFVGDSPLEITRNVVERPAASIRQSNSSVDIDLETIVLKCLEKNPQHRYDSAAALADDLRRYLNGKPILARRSSSLEQVAKWARRNKALATLLSAVVCLLTIGLMGSLAFSWRIQSIADQRKDALASLSEQEAETVRQRDQAIRRLFESKSAEVSARRTSRERGQKFQAVAAAKSAVEQLDRIQVSEKELFELRSETAGSLGLADIEAVGRWTAMTVGTFRYAFSPNLEHFFRQRNDGDPVEGYLTKKLITSGNANAQPPDFTVDIGKGSPDGHTFDFSPCGRFIQFFTIYPRRLFVYDIARKKLIWNEPSDAPGWLGQRDGKPILIAPETSGYVVRELPSMEVKNTMPGKDRYLNLRISPDGELLAGMRGRGGHVVVRSTRDGALIWQKDLYLHGVDGYRWHPHEPILAIPNVSRLELWRVGDDQPWKVLTGAHYNHIHLANFSSDGEYIATSSWGQKSRIWRVSTGEPVLSFSGVVNRFSADGSQVAIGKSQIGIWNFHGETVRRTIATPEPPGAGTKPTDLVIHPNGRWVALGQENGTRLFDLRTGTPLAELPSGIALVRFHPDGTKLYVTGDTPVEWPITENLMEDGRMELVLGPPRPIPLRRRGYVRPGQLDVDPSGRLIAMSNAGETLLVDAKDTKTVVNKISTRRASTGVSISQGGELVVVGNHHGNNAEVYDGKTGEHLKTIPTPTHTKARLSPDGSRLVVNYNGIAELYETKTWRQLRAWTAPDAEVGWPASFSLDGRYVLLSLDEPRGTLIANAKTGKDLIRIPGRSGRAPRDTPPCLTSDGNLVMISEGNGLEVWDIHQVRDELAKLGLDWESQSESSSALQNSPVADQIANGEQDTIEPPLVRVIWGDSQREGLRRSLASLHSRQSIDTATESLDQLIRNSPEEFVFYEMRGQLRFGREHWTAAKSDLEKAILLGKGNVEASTWESLATIRRYWGERAAAIESLRQSQKIEPGGEARLLLAWELCLSPEQMFEPTEALELVKEVVKAFPDVAKKVHCAALFRAGRHSEAIEELNSLKQSIIGTHLSQALNNARKGDLTEAVQELGKLTNTAAATDASLYGTHFFLALAYAKEGELAKAQESYQNEIEFMSQLAEEVDSVRMRDWMMLKRECEQTLGTAPDSTTDSIHLDAADLVAAAWTSQGMIGTQHHNKRRAAIAADTQSTLSENVNAKGDNDAYNLFWRTVRPDGKLTVEFDVPAAGEYNLQLDMVTSWDYGKVAFALNEKSIADTFDGYSAGIFHGARIDVKRISLRKGKNTLTLLNRGKSQSSSGYLAGIESLTLVPRTGQ